MSFSPLLSNVFFRYTVVYMKRVIIALFLFVYCLSSYSQFWISSVSSSPFPANDCDNLSITIDGNLSSSNCTYVSSSIVSGNLITIDINVTCGGIGIPVITPYTETINLGTISSNNYSLVVNQYSSGSLQETNTSSLNIGTCCASVAAINLAHSSNCIGDASSFIDLGTIADSLIWTDNGNVFSPNISALGWIYNFNTPGVHNITLTAIDSSGCSDTSNVVLTIYDLPEIIMSPVSASCNTCADGEVFVTVVSGPMPHQLLWSTGGSSNPLTGLNPGSYIATLTDGNTCSTTDSINVGNSVSIFENNNLDFSFFPNPSKGKFSLNINDKKSRLKLIQVFDLYGKLILTKFLEINSNSLYEVDLEINKGIYLLKINNKSKKLIIR